MNEKLISEYKILVVDDSRLFCNAIRSIVLTKFKAVETAQSGQEAIDKIENFLPDIVLLDVTMPNMDGRECLEKILKKQPSTIVVMISGVQKEDLKKECLDLGAALFLNKDQINVQNEKVSNFLVGSLEDLLQKHYLQKAGSQ